MDEIIEALQKKGSDKPQEPSLGTVLVKERIYHLIKLPRQLKLIHQLKKVKKHQLDLRQKTS
ncbi:MAG: hypothetical protein ACLR3O_02130 [Streptococcus sp.]